MDADQESKLFQADEERSSQAHIYELLKPLQEGNGEAYVEELKQVSEVERRFRALESLYASSYRRVQGLEREISDASPEFDPR